MTPEKKSDGNHGQNWPFAVGDLPVAMRMQTEAWFKEQADLLGSMQSMIAAWMKRRQDGTEAAFRTFERICGCKDGADAMAACREWLADSTGLLMADLTAAHDEAVRMTRIGHRTLSAFSQAGAPAASAEPAVASAKAGENKTIIKLRRPA